MAWLSDALSMVATRRRPRAQRRAKFVNAKWWDGDCWWDAQIGNISETGLMLRTNHPAEVGQTIEVRRRSWSVIGEVVWKNGTRIGVKASAPIDAYELSASSDLSRRFGGRVHTA